MNEHLWRTESEPWPLLNFLGADASRRKLRLFTCACCRQVLNPFAPRLVERALDAAEAFADREIAADLLAQVAQRVGEAIGAARDADYQNGTGYLSHLLDAVAAACWADEEAEAASDAALATARAAADLPWPAPGTSRPPEFVSELAVQADLLRDIFGNPFVSVGLEVEWLTDTVTAMAKKIYADRDFSAMPILADALQDAGCDDDDILTHCRADREHVRGCWVVDLLLGRN